MKIREVFEYEVDTDNIDEVFKIEDYITCVNNMTCPFWDGYKVPELIKQDFEILEN